MKNIHAIPDEVLDEQIKDCHRILKDGDKSELKFKRAEQALPMLRQERNRRDNVYVARQVQSLFDLSKKSR